MKGPLEPGKIYPPHPVLDSEIWFVSWEQIAIFLRLYPDLFAVGYVRRHNYFGH